MGNIFKAAAPIIGGIVGGPVGAAIGGAAAGATGGGGLKGALIGGATGYAGNVVGSSIGSSLSSSLGKVGGTSLGSLSSNSAGPYSFGNLGSVAGNSIGNTVANTSIASALGSYAGNSIADSVGSSLFPQESMQDTSSDMGQAKPFQAARNAQLTTPNSLSGFDSLDDQQQGTNLATQGTYGGGLGGEEQSYFTNLINRRLVDDAGQVDSDLSEINPIEKSYLSQLGLNQDNPQSLLEALSKWKAQ